MNSSDFFAVKKNFCKYTVFVTVLLSAASAFSAAPLTETAGIQTLGIYNKTHNSQRAGFNGYTRGNQTQLRLPVTNSVLVGIAYTRADSDIKSGTHKTNIDTDHIQLAVKYKPKKWYMAGALGFGYNTYKDKTNSFTKNHGKLYRASVFSGYEMTTANQCHVTNYSGVKYTYSDPEKTNQTRLQPKKSAELTTLVIGTTASKTFQPSQNTFVQPKFRLETTYDIKSNNHQAVIELPDTNVIYALDAHRLHRAAIDSGVGMTVGYKKLSLALGYGVNWRVSQVSQTGSVSLKYHF